MKKPDQLEQPSDSRNVNILHDVPGRQSESATEASYLIFKSWNLDISL